MNGHTQLCQKFISFIKLSNLGSSSEPTDVVSVSVLSFSSVYTTGERIEVSYKHRDIYRFIKSLITIIKKAEKTVSIIRFCRNYGYWVNIKANNIISDFKYIITS